MSIHDRIITPDTDPDRFTAEEEAYFRAGKCGMTTAFGTPWTEHCGQPSGPGASFGNCAEHNAELLEEFYPDGTRRIEPQHDMDPFPELRGELATSRPHVITAAEAQAEARRIRGKS